MVKKLQNHGKNEMKDCGVQRISYICGAKDHVIEKMRKFAALINYGSDR